MPPKRSRYGGGSASDAFRKAHAAGSKTAELISKHAPGTGTAYEYTQSTVLPEQQTHVAKVKLEPVDVFLDGEADDSKEIFEATLQESREEGHICLVCIDTVTVPDPIWQCGR